MPAYMIVDTREKASGVPRMLQAEGFNIVYRNLTVADYVLSPQHAVERKEVGDFVGSMISGRLFDQLGRLAEAYDFPMAVVEGDLTAAVESFPNPKSIWGALAALSFGFDVRLFFTPNTANTAQLVAALMKHIHDRGYMPPVARERQRMASTMQLQRFIVASLPGVGPKTADRLLRRFGSVRKVFTATTGPMAGVAGFGVERARRIAEILDARYTPDERREIDQRFIDEDLTGKA
ncbi:MAG: ERCC4 domain-containing protein [Candidatus Bathyarchaeia archaeon]